MTTPRASIDGIALKMTAALGRPFQLGMLYDCRSDTIVTGLSLWDNKTIEKMTHSERMENSTVQIITEDSLDKKSKHLGISGEGKLGIMSGLVDVSGSAEYVNDTKSSEKHTRVSLHYQSISDFRDIDIDLEKLKDPEYKRMEVVDIGVATHVVTGVLYGADAVFVFDHVVSNQSKKSALQLQGEMEASIKKLQLKASAEMHLNEEQESTKDNMSCKFYGDVILKDLPTTFTEARDTYDKVIKEINIGKSEDPTKDEKVVPKKVWLLPLKAFIRNAPNIGKSINDITVSKVQAVVDEFQQIKVKVMDLKTEYSFPPFSDYIHRQFDEFLSILDGRLSELKIDMKKILPKIRGGTADEQELYDLLKTAKKPPFDKSTAKNWVKAKENEITTFKSFFTLISIEGVEIAGTSGQFNSLLIDDQWEFLLVLEFKVPHPNFNPFSLLGTSIDLSAKSMFEYLLSLGKIEAADQKEWINYMDPKEVLDQKLKINSFANFVMTNYVKDCKKIKFAVTLVEAEPDIDVRRDLVSTNLYSGDGCDDVVVPSEPTKLEVEFDSKDNTITVNWEKPHLHDNRDEIIIKYVVILTVDRTKKTTTETCTDFEVKFNILPNQKYTVSVQAALEANNLVVGLSAKNEKSFIFPTP